MVIDGYVDGATVKGSLMIGAAIAALLSSGCGTVAGDAAGTQGAVTLSGEIRATVRAIDVEGGCWVLDSATRRLQPVEFPPEYRRDGKQVLVIVQDAPETLSACQAGTPVTLMAIRAAD